MKNQRRLERIILDLEELEEEARDVNSCKKLEEVIRALKNLYLTD